MKKITFLFSLLLTFLGVSSAYADAGDVITDLSQLSSKKSTPFQVKEVH